MGLAPLHTWLPDAHSEAPVASSRRCSPAALLNCAFLGILRVHARRGRGRARRRSARELLVVLRAALHGARRGLHHRARRDYKRMLAYSSVEHMGILAARRRARRPAGVRRAAPRGQPLAGQGRCSSCSAGNILAAYRTKTRRRGRAALLRVLPVSGALWLAGLPRDHRLAALRAVRQRVRHPQRRAASGAHRPWPAALPRCCSASSSSAWRAIVLRHGPGRAARARGRPDARRGRLARSLPLLGAGAPLVLVARALPARAGSRAALDSGCAAAGGAP
ncbi:MAG: hypothetical protein MZU95_04635 [Desulfomicrobium escambiense]|nr:hypothetical protein [Desulfomicrobium escambiense]